MTTITIEITDTEYSAMEYAALSPEDWSDNAVKNRARIAIDEIVQLYTSKALDEGVQIPTTREEIVADAFARGWVKTSAQVNAEIETPV
jgi:hypothetical protein